MDIKTVMCFIPSFFVRNKDVSDTLMTPHHTWQQHLLIEVWCSRRIERENIFWQLARYCFYALLDNSFMPEKQQSVSKKRQGRRKTHRVDGNGVVYPVDLWFLIGSYISPEDVSTFACICHDTHLVAHSARFWLSIYRRSAYQLLLYKILFNLFFYQTCIPREPSTQDMVSFCLELTSWNSTRKSSTDSVYV